MLDAAWDDVPEQLRPAATVTLAAHLDKLQAEGRLPGRGGAAGPGGAQRFGAAQHVLPRRPTEPRGAPGPR